MKACGKRQQAPRSAKLLSIYNLFKSLILEANSETVRKLTNLMDLPAEDCPDNILVDNYKMGLHILFNNQVARDIASMNMGRMNYMYKSVQSVIDYSNKLKLRAEETNLLWRTFLDQHPIPSIFASKMDYLDDKFKRIQKDSIKTLEAFTSQEIMTKFWDDKVFSMRNSNSRVLAQSRMLKDYWKIMKDLNDKGFSETFTVRSFERTLSPKVRLFQAAHRTLKAMISGF